MKIYEKLITYFLVNQKQRNELLQNLHNVFFQNALKNKLKKFTF